MPTKAFPASANVSPSPPDSGSDSISTLDRFRERDPLVPALGRRFDTGLEPMVHINFRV